MRIIRLAWSLLTLAVGAFGLIATYLAAWPESQFTACEIEPGRDTAACDESLIDRGGFGYVVALLLPTILCAVPVVFPRRSIAWATVGALIVSGIVVVATVGGVAMMLAATAVPAFVLAACHARLAAQDHTASIGGRSLLRRLRQQQQNG
ncbi:hypothetical protein O4215_01255 [Rhodococcus maanshanensis]|uniref:hypothetical protein n=1 Tax=Rhodococcus maanshanensis TaxID=183556 RepID=UPI0022B4FF65|nr:hypothetical protein [Rhodococcus maanshanensis]MCZ4554188.1 hypothetical protein [Rhodococcus maanshanensis]